MSIVLWMVAVLSQIPWWAYAIFAWYILGVIGGGFMLGDAIWRMTYVRKDGRGIWAIALLGPLLLISLVSEPRNKGFALPGWSARRLEARVKRLYAEYGALLQKSPELREKPEYFGHSWDEILFSEQARLKAA